MNNFKRIVAFLLISSSVYSQEYIEEGKNRLNFAKTYFELGGQYADGFLGKKVLNNGSITSFENSKSITPYLNIGGLHFWGHADFFISIPMRQLNFEKSDSTSFVFNKSVGTGARYLPWKYQDNKIRPYIGLNWAIQNFQNRTKPKEDQPLFTQSRLVFDTGILYGNNNWMVRLGASFDPNTNKTNYPISVINTEKIKIPRLNMNLGLIYSFESTRSKKLENINKELIKYPNRSAPTLNADKRGDWFFGVGPSTSFLLNKSQYNKTYFPYFNKKPISNLFLDFGIGYHFNKLGFITALAYRNPVFGNQAFGAEQRISKNTLSFELYKFLTDYSGFTPYVGLNLSYSQIKYSETKDANVYSQNYNQIRPGLTFGWDILPGKTEQPTVLRTNLRWFPLDNLNIKGEKFNLNQIEYDVIQLVFYPARSKRFKNKY